jgi:putative ABC transport system ATP-binding protein
VTVVEARSVVREYDSGGGTLRALDDVDVGVEPGEFVAVVGPSGSGKSTLMNVLGLLDVPTAGRVTLRGDPVSEMSVGERTRRRKETVGFVFQEFYLVPTLSALENVELPRFLDREPSVSRARAADLLERVGLGDYLTHRPDQLSGGQKQRVAVARALVNEPAVLLADEPTGNLDRGTGDEVLAEFRAVADDGVAVVTVTHDDYVADAADRVVELVDGRVQP